MIKIFRKEGWILNPNDKVVNAILTRAEENNGECPCQNPGITHEDRCCPCKEYRENDVCHCSLYIKPEPRPQYKCFACGGELIWGTDFMRSEIEGVADDEEDTVVNVLHCKDCGATVYVYHNNETK